MSETDEKKKIYHVFYNDVRRFGIIGSNIVLAIGIIVSLSLIGGGAYLIISKGEFTKETKGKVIENSVCSDFTDRITRFVEVVSNQVIRECRTKVEYEINGVKYTNLISTGTKSYSVGSEIDLVYNENDIYDIQTKSNFRRNIGIALMIGGLTVLFVSIIQFYFTYRSKIGPASIDSYLR